MAQRFKEYIQALLFSFATELLLLGEKENENLKNIIILNIIIYNIIIIFLFLLDSSEEK